jgi:hypothetical protein
MGITSALIKLRDFFAGVDPRVSKKLKHSLTFCLTSELAADILV